MVEQVSSLKTGIKYKNTPIGKIPVDWEVIQLEAICEEIYRYPTYYNIKYVEQNGVPEVRGELIKNNGELSSDPSEYRYISKETSANFPRTILHEGDFVLSVRGTMGKIGYIPSNLENANMTANLMRISPNRNKVYPLWLKQFFLSDFFQNSLDQASSATTIKTIRAPELKAIDLALPSLSEQKRIAEILTTADEVIDKTDQIIKKTKEVKKGLIHRLLTRGIDHNQFKKTEVGEIPEEWEIVKLGDICLISSGGASNYSRDVNEKTYPVYGSNGVIGSYDKYNFSDGFVIGRVGASGSIQLVSWPIWASDNTLLLSINEELTHKLFLYYYLQKCNLPLLATKTAQPLITQNILKRVLITKPNISEQEKIAEILSSIDEEIEKESNRKKELEALKKGLMQVLLMGKIRVSA